MHPFLNRFWHSHFLIVGAGVILNMLEELKLSSWVQWVCLVSLMNIPIIHKILKLAKTAVSANSLFFFFLLS